MTPLSGSCLCGAVRFQVEDRFAWGHLCHCTQCQKATGTAHATNLFTDPDNVTWLQGEELVRRYDVEGRTISSAFCLRCGSNLPYRSKSGQTLVVPAGSLDDTPSTGPERHIFFAERMPWWESAHGLPRSNGFPPDEPEEPDEPDEG